MSAVERFSIECHKTETKVITTANQMKSKYHKKPMRTQSKYMQTAISAGKREWPSRHWFQFCIWLVGKMARLFKTNHRS